MAQVLLRMYTRKLTTRPLARVRAMQVYALPSFMMSARVDAKIKHSSKRANPLSLSVYTDSHHCLIPDICRSV